MNLWPKMPSDTTREHQKIKMFLGACNIWAACGARQLTKVTNLYYLLFFLKNCFCLFSKYVNCGRPAALDSQASGGHQKTYF